MAETVLSMARSMLGAAVKTAASAAAAEMSLLMGVRKDIWFMKDEELETMQAFLVAAEAMKEKDMLLKVWAKQVRDLSYDIEDCLGEFMVHVGSQSLSQQLLKLKDRHRIATQIRDLKSRVAEVSYRNTRYSLVKPISSSTEDERDSSLEDIRNHSASSVGEAEFVGFAHRKKKLLELLDVDANDGHVKVISVVGMGGLGKTAITRKVYDSKDDIAKKFSCCAWVTVSQSFDRIGLLKDMIRQILGPSLLDQLLQGIQGKVASQVVYLAQHLMEELKEKRYIIVLDDLWTLDAWNWIKGIAFPKDNNKGSRIVITTRDVGLAKECTLAERIYHLERLEMEEAITLLLSKTNRTHEDMERHKMNKIVELVVKKCGHLPLAILTVGAVLASKEVLEWQTFYDQLPSELESNPSLEALRRMVTLSYNHLPSHLKPCFLYLSIFPEDFEIKRSRLVDRWIAEGFVRDRVGMTLKEVGENYFNELINRSMIQPSRVNIEGVIKRCRVHDIVRDITISISRREGFVCLAEDKATSVGAENFRHIACHGSERPMLGMDWSHVRSLTMFGERPKELAPSLCSPDLRMLRALDAFNANFGLTQKDINNIGLLRHLKYVNIRHGDDYSTIYKLPRYIAKLQGLQILEIGYSLMITLPSEISELRSLRTLRCRTMRDYAYFDTEDPLKCMLSVFIYFLFEELKAPRFHSNHNTTDT